MTTISRTSNKAVSRFMNTEKASNRVYLFNPVDAFHSMKKAERNNLMMRVPTISVDGVDVPYTRIIDLNDKQVRDANKDFSGMARIDDKEKVVFFSEDLPAAEGLQSDFLSSPSEFDAKYLGDLSEYRSDNGMGM